MIPGAVGRGSSAPGPSRRHGVGRQGVGRHGVGRHGVGRRVRAALVAVAVLVLTGCGVTTSVAVRVQRNGSGTVTVAVTLDRAAVSAVGGVEGALHVSDLEAAGWKVVSGPAPGGGTVITLTQSFTRLSQLPGILAEVGRTPAGAPLFVLRVTQGGTFFTSRTTAAGSVDLTCGLSCFGDAGLQRTYGSDLGVDSTALQTAAGRAAIERDLTFRFTLQMPGRVSSSDALPAPVTPPLDAGARAADRPVGHGHRGRPPPHHRDRRRRRTDRRRLGRRDPRRRADPASRPPRPPGRRGHRRRHSPPVPSSRDGAPPDRSPLP